MQNIDETKPFFVDIMTTPKNADEPPVRPMDRINYHSWRARGWMIRHIWHCLHSGLAVHIAPIDTSAGAA